ncbi:hypothetical protein ACHAXA_006846 [Cyclostephanos tholiformis]|uniref:Uncharacterized protein n=1 Tax=Cyclostephanos tholiformis TaxID=382380 RepID=A0ABD3R5K2_9STRA
MLKAKIGFALLAFSACKCRAANNGDNERYKRHPRRHLRRGMIMGKKYQPDLTEDVAFWARKLQFSLPPVPTPDKQSQIPTNVDVETASPVAMDPTDPPIAGPAGIPPNTPTAATTSSTDPPVEGPVNMLTNPPTPSTTSATDPPVGSAPPVAIDPTDPPLAGPPDMPSYPPTQSTISATDPPATEQPVGTTTATDPPASAPSDGGAVAVADATTISSSDGIAFIAVLENDTPAAGQSLSVKKADGASNGICSIGLDLLEVVYQPNVGFVGVDVCEYEACDDREPPLCVSATVTITVT